MIKCQSEAEQILKPYLQILYNVIDMAIKEFKTDPLRIFYNNRTRSCAINDLIIKNALTELSSMPGVRFKSARGSTYLIIREQFLMKFKKFNRKLHTSNIPTRPTKNFLHQESVLFDTPPVITNIFTGYTWNRFENKASGIYITCPLGKNNAWVIPLLSNDSLLAEVIPFNNNNEYTKKRKRTQPRRAKKDVSSNDNQ